MRVSRRQQWKERITSTQLAERLGMKETIYRHSQEASPRMDGDTIWGVGESTTLSW